MMDMIFFSKKIYTVTDGLIDGAVGVTGNKIAYVGDRKGAEELAGPDTEVVELGEHLLMPGLIEGHTHMQAYCESVDFADADSLEECRNMIIDFHEKHPDVSPIPGKNWFAANWGGKMPSKNDIDPFMPDIPFWAGDMEMHRVWLNSAMMELIGLTKNNLLVFSKNRPQMVEVDADGNPTGLVNDEVAMDIILSQGVTPDQDNVRKMFEVWTEYGVTSINDMDFYTIDSEMLHVTKELEEKGELNVRVFSSLDAMKTDDADIENGKSWMNSDMFRLNALKSFLDGTGAGLTAFMLKPYKGTDNYGNSYRTSEQLRSFIKRASEHGLATHFHACGDAAVRQAVEAYEWATDNGIRLDERSSIEHLDTALLSDVQRTVKLGITLNMTPDFLAPTKHWKDNPYIGIYDEDVENEELFSLGSFIDTGVNVSFGTDGTASSMNPMDQLFRAVTRVANDYKPEGGFRPVEAISIEDAIYHYTIGSARTIGMEDRLGSIEEGKYADMIVMDTDLLTASPAEIKAAKPVMTISDGRIVYINQRLSAWVQTRKRKNFTTSLGTSQKSMC